MKAFLLTIISCLTPFLALENEEPMVSMKTSPPVANIYYKNKLKCLDSLYRSQLVITLGKCLIKNRSHYSVGLDSTNDIKKGSKPSLRGISRIISCSIESEKTGSGLAVLILSDTLYPLTFLDYSANSAQQYGQPYLDLDRTSISFQHNPRLVLYEWSMNEFNSNSHLASHDVRLVPALTYMKKFGLNLEFEFCGNLTESYKFDLMHGTPLFHRDTIGWKLVGIVSHTREPSLPRLVRFIRIATNLWIDKAQDLDSEVVILSI